MPEVSATAGVAAGVVAGVGAGGGASGAFPAPGIVPGIAPPGAGMADPGGGGVFRFFGGVPSMWEVVSCCSFVEVWVVVVMVRPSLCVVLRVTPVGAFSISDKAGASCVKWAIL